MVYRVLIVDDSQFFQSRLKKMINECPQLNVIGIASNGQEAIEKDSALKPDIISMDYEMPVVDGITAVKTILSKRNVPIVMFSSMTYEGARITLEALDAGAVDFMPKNFAEVSKDSTALKTRLHEKFVTFARNAKPEIQGGTAPLEVSEPTSGVDSRNRHSARAGVKDSALISPQAPNGRPETQARFKNRTKLLAIGASTGGPVAVADIITKLPANYPIPIVVVQHMPEKFTRAFADRLNGSARLTIKEAETGDMIRPGTVLIAPGNKHLMMDKSGSTVKVIDADERVSYKPSVDVFFASAANALGSRVLAIVLTGMGADGLEGARLLKQKGSHIWAQNRETSVVFGMPAAVINANLTETVLPIDQVAAKLTSEF